MKRILLALAVCLLWACNAYAQPGVQGSICYTTNGRNCVPAIQASNSVAIAISTATTTKVITAVTGQLIFVTSFDLVSTAANTAQWVYGTTVTNPCDTGRIVLTGAYGMSTFTVITKGNGSGPILFVPVSNDLCLVSTTTGAINGSVSYVQF
jgi:hypothetical protein